MRKMAGTSDLALGRAKIRPYSFCTACGRRPSNRSSRKPNTLPAFGFIRSNIEEVSGKIEGLFTIDMEGLVRRKRVEMTGSYESN